MTKDNTKEIEAMARAVCDADANDYDAMAKTYHGRQQLGIIRRQQEAALTALQSLGWRHVPEDCVVVPKEPTVEMVRAAYFLKNMYDSFHTAKEPEEAYLAMLAAAPKDEERKS